MCDDLTTPRDFWDCGYGYGVGGDELAAALISLARDLARPVSEWEAEKFAQGWRTGVRDAADEARGRADREAGILPPADGDTIPF